MADKRHTKTAHRLGKLTAIVPVRSGSTRCVGKNHRPFGDTSLLVRRVTLLKSISSIDEVVVSSDCPLMLKVASDFGAIPHRRKEGFARRHALGA